MAEEKQEKNNTDVPSTTAEEKQTSPKEAKKLSPEEQLVEMTDILKRTQANFENYRKQSELRMQEMIKVAGKHVIMQLLPVIDHFELSLKHCTIEKNQPEFYEGIQLIHSQMQVLLEQNGVHPIETVGKKFDPYLHEALLKVPSDEEEGMILEEFQKGYLLHNQVIRHAKVKISSGKRDGQEQAKEKQQEKQKEKQQEKHHEKQDNNKQKK